MESGRTISDQEFEIEYKRFKEIFNEEKYLINSYYVAGNRKKF
jgi:hypothetical protein